VSEAVRRRQSQSQARGRKERNGTTQHACGPSTNGPTNAQQVGCGRGKNGGDERGCMSHPSGVGVDEHWRGTEEMEADS